MVHNSITSGIKHLVRLGNEHFALTPLEKTIVKELQKQYRSKYDFLQIMQKERNYYPMIRRHMDRLASNKVGLIEKVPLTMNDELKHDRTPYRLSDLGWMYCFRHGYVNHEYFLNSIMISDDRPFFITLLQKIFDDNTIIEISKNALSRIVLFEYIQNYVLTAYNTIQWHRMYAKYVKDYPKEQNQRDTDIENEIAGRTSFMENHLLADLNWLVYGELKTGQDIGIINLLAKDKKYPAELDKFVQKTITGYLGFNRFIGRELPAPAK